MSHTVAVKDLLLTNNVALVRAAKRMGTDVQTLSKENSVKLYTGAPYTAGSAVQLSGWKYPVVIKEDGGVVYDNYNGAWGSARLLDNFLQFYSVEVATIGAEEEGWMVRETLEKNGEIMLEMEEGMTR